MSEIYQVGISNLKSQNQSRNGAIQKTEQATYVDYWGR